MLPFALKVAWLVLCALGTIATWVVFWLLAQSINTYWLPMAYCIGLTVLEGIFCLGMIYHMDPARMPRPFCLAQIFTISFSALWLTGVCLIIILATTTAIAWPSAVRSSPQSTLRWRWPYLFPLLVVPAVFAGLQLGLMIKYDAYGPSDNIHCDVIGPHLWISLLGYAGMPALESIPFLAFDVLAGFRVYGMFKAHRRSAMGALSIHFSKPCKEAESPSTENNITVITTSVPAPPVPPHSPLRRASPAPSQPQLLSQSQSLSDLELDLTRSLSIPSPVPHGPIRWSTHSESAFLFPPTSSPDQSPVSLRPSSAFAKIDRAPPSPTFRPYAELGVLPLQHAHSLSLSRNTSSHVAYPCECYTSTPTTRMRALSVATPLSPSLAARPELSSHNETDSIYVLNAYGSIDASTASQSQSQAHSRTAPLHEEKERVSMEGGGVRWDELSQPLSHILHAPKSFFSLAWRLILFFLLFFLVQILITLSTIIDVSSGQHSLTPFGTECVALLLAAWGPVIIFAHVPGVRARLAFWR